MALNVFKGLCCSPLVFVKERKKKSYKELEEPRWVAWRSKMIEQDESLD